MDSIDEPQACIGAPGAPLFTLPPRKPCPHEALKPTYPLFGPSVIADLIQRRRTKCAGIAVLARSIKAILPSVLSSARRDGPSRKESQASKTCGALMLFFMVYNYWSPSHKNKTAVKSAFWVLNGCRYDRRIVDDIDGS